MAIDTDKVDEDVLALLYLTSFREKHDWPWRTWKSHDWDTMERLFKKGFISNPHGKAKSVVFSEEGYRKAEALFKSKYGSDEEPAPTENSDEQEIRQLVKTWAEATKKGDIPQLLSLMAEDVVFLIAGRETPMIGRSAFEAAAKAQSISSASRPEFEGESDIREIQVLGDWAFLWTKLKVTVTPAGGAPPVTRAGHTLSILKKQDGRWVLARDANMLSQLT